MEVTFYVEKRKTNSKGLAPVLATFHKGNLRCPISLSISVVPEAWNQKDQRLYNKGGQILADDINNKLSKRKNLLIQIDTEADIMGIQLTKGYIKKRFKELLTPDAPKTEVTVDNSFHKALDRFIEDSETGERKTKKGKKISEGTIKNYKALRGVIEDYEKTKGRLNWGDITYKGFYTLFCNWLWDEREHNEKIGSFDNNVGKYIKTFKAFLNYCAEEIEIIPHRLYNSKWITWKEEEGDFIVIYPDEITWLYNVTDTKLIAFSPDLAEVRDRFLIGCHTCLRIGDLQKVKFEKMGNVFSYSLFSQKTTTKTQGTLSVKFSNILKKYPKGFSKITDQEYNRRLKTLGSFLKNNAPENLTQNWKGSFVRNRLKRGNVVQEEIPMYKAISSHTQRRSGITNLVISGKFSIPEIMEISGHASMREFMKYVKIANRFLQSKSAKHWDESILVNISD